MTREYAYDFAVFVGRFQPLHIGHQHVIERALEQAQTLIILIGSADSARSIQNPFTYDERRHFIEACYRYEMATSRIVVAGVFDRHYNDEAWIADIQRIVSALVLKIGNHGGVGLHGTANFKVGLAGYKKDGSSYYLKMFPDWGAIDVPSQYGTFNSTDIRNHYFRRSPSLPHDICSPEVVEILKDFRLTPEFSSLVGEREFMDDYKASWAGSPFPPVFVRSMPSPCRAAMFSWSAAASSPAKGCSRSPAASSTRTKRCGNPRFASERGDDHLGRKGRDSAGHAAIVHR